MEVQIMYICLTLSYNAVNVSQWQLQLRLQKHADPFCNTEMSEELMLPHQFLMFWKHDSTCFSTAPYVPVIRLLGTWQHIHLKCKKCQRRRGTKNPKIKKDQQQQVEDGDWCSSVTAWQSQWTVPMNCHLANLAKHLWGKTSMFISRI